MILKFVPREPDKAYISNQLLLPKAGIRAGAVKRALEFIVPSQGGQVQIALWGETTNHLLCPREFIKPQQYTNYLFPFIDVRPSFEHVEFEDLVQPRDEEQLKAWNALAMHDNGILNLGCGKGKALAHGQTVVTARGHVPIENITTSDLVVGTDGRFHRVLGVFPQGEREIYRVAFTDGTHLDCDADHLWTFVLRRTKGAPTETITTKELSCRSLRGVSGRLYYLPDVSPVNWPQQSHAVDPYTLGALLGDGHLSRPNRVEFTTADTQMLSLMPLPSAHRFIKVPGRNSGKATTYGVSSSRSDAQKLPRLAEHIAELGLMGTTSHEKFIPESYKYTSAEDRLAVLQGLFDTDGSPTAAGAVEYSTVSKRLADDVTEVVQSLGGTCIRQHRVTRCGGKDFRSLRLLVKLPDGMPLFRLDRKISKVPSSRQRRPYRAVESVTYIGRGQATCITVRSRDHLFLAGAYIPTHNTKLAVKKIAQRNVPTLVVVPDGGILEQWKQSILGGDRSPQGLRFNGSLGLIQGQTFDWKHPVTLALITTLALRAKAGELPEEMLRWFGQVIFDEVHQMGAPVFSLPTPYFYGDRIGLTATVEREDGLDPIYRFHIGEPFYTDLTQDLVPRIYFQQTYTRLDLEKAKAKKQNTINISMLRSLLGTDYESNIYRYWCIQEALKEGRKVLCLSHSKNQLKLFHSLFPGSSIITAETERSERMNVLRNSQVCFAIARLGSVGVDDDALDTLFWLTPFRSRISLQQSMGRIQRKRDGKKTPVMVVFEDVATPPLRNLCSALKKNLREWGFKFDVVHPRELPVVFPEEARLAYESTRQVLGVDEAE